MADFSLSVTCLSSAIAGSLSRLLLHPVDTLKAKLQVQKSSASPQFTSLSSAFRYTLQQEGLKGLYRGLSFSIAGSLPAVTLYFSSYELGKNLLLAYPRINDSPFLAYLAGGLIAETCACVIFVPIDVVKERLQVQSNLKLYSYRGGFDAIRQILATEGFFGIYKAYGATVGSFGPFSALYFLFYESLKKRTAAGEQIGFGASLLCSGIAGSLASWLTSPLDLAKLRMQVVRSAKAHGVTPHFQYRHLLHGIYSIATQEGPAALFKGAFARVLFHTPNTALVMSLLELLRPRVSHLLSS